MNNETHLSTSLHSYVQLSLTQSGRFRKIPRTFIQLTNQQGNMAQGYTGLNAASSDNSAGNICISGPPHLVMELQGRTELEGLRQSYETQLTVMMQATRWQVSKKSRFLLACHSLSLSQSALSVSWTLLALSVSLFQSLFMCVSLMLYLYLCFPVWLSHSMKTCSPRQGRCLVRIFTEVPAHSQPQQWNTEYIYLDPLSSDHLSDLSDHTQHKPCSMSYISPPAACVCMKISLDPAGVIYKVLQTRSQFWTGANKPPATSLTHVGSEVVKSTHPSLCCLRGKVSMWGWEPASHRDWKQRPLEAGSGTHRRTLSERVFVPLCLYHISRSFRKQSAFRRINQKGVSKYYNLHSTSKVLNSKVLTQERYNVLYLCRSHTNPVWHEHSSYAETTKFHIQPQPFTTETYKFWSWYNKRNTAA